MDHDKPHFLGLTMQAALDEIMIKKKKVKFGGGAKWYFYITFAEVTNATN